MCQRVDDGVCRYRPTALGQVVEIPGRETRLVRQLPIAESALLHEPAQRVREAFT
jgi:hypothetical protein